MEHPLSISGRNVPLFIAIASLTTLADYLSKSIALRTTVARPHEMLFGIVRLGYARNHGGIFGMGAQLPWAAHLFTVVGAMLLFVTTVMALSRSRGALALSGMALLVGGGLGNWLDRAFRGQGVIDFIDVGIGVHRTGFFNVADVAIVIGAAWFVVTATRTESSCSPRGARYEGQAHLEVEEQRYGGRRRLRSTDGQ